MNAPKPKPPLKKPEPKQEKKPFVRKEHLSERPLKAHEGLQQLLKNMNKSETKGKS